MTSARAWLQRGAVVAPWLTALVLWRNYQASNDLSPAEAGQNFIDAIDNAWWGVLAFVGAYVLRPVVLFPASVLTVMGGILFGPLLGVLVVVVGANISAMIAFSIGRLLGRPRDTERAGATAFADTDTRASFAQRWSQRLRENSFETVFVMRLIFLPYDLVNYACGALGIRWSSFLLATILGSIPGTISFVLLGASLERIDQGLGGINPIAIFASAAIFLVSLIVSRTVKRRYQPEPELA